MARFEQPGEDFNRRSGSELVEPSFLANPHERKCFLWLELRGRSGVVISRVGEIEVQATSGALFLTLGLAALSAIRWGGWSGLAIAGLLAGSLVLHELGHLLMAQALGVRVKAIGLCLKGAYLRRLESRQAKYELLIAMAGPAMNFLLYAWLRDADLQLKWVAILNLVLAVSNLAPFPGTDGSRICQSLQSLASGNSGLPRTPSQ